MEPEEVKERLQDEVESMRIETAAEILLAEMEGEL